MEIIRRVFRRRAPEWPPGDPAAFEPIGVPPVPGTRATSRVTRYVGLAGDRLRQSPAFAPFSRLAVGLTYEGGLLKLLVCEGTRVVSWETIPFDPRMVAGGAVVEPYNLGRLIRDALARRGLPRWRVHCGLPAMGSLSRVVELPRLGARDRRRLVVGEAMRALGVSPGRHYVYWQVVEETTDHQLVFALAVPREAMRSLVETMRAAGIRPRTVDITPLALARGVGQSDAVVVELDPHGVDIAVVLDDVPVVVRSLVFGDPLTLEEAQQAAIDLLAAELRRYEDLYVGSRVPTTVPVYLAGDLGGGLRLADRVRSATGHPVGRLAPLLDYPEEFPAGQYLANAGLVLKEL